MLLGTTEHTCNSPLCRALHRAEQFWPIILGNLLNSIKKFLIFVSGFFLAKPKLLVPAEKFS